MKAGHLVDALTDALSDEVDRLTKSPCSWCGRLLAECFCGDCGECGFFHDGGAPRTGRVVRIVRGSDGLVHVSQWERADVVIPLCWPGLNHVDPYPRSFEFETDAGPVNCLNCLGA